MVVAGVFSNDLRKFCGYEKEKREKETIFLIMPFLLVMVLDRNCLPRFCPRVQYHLSDPGIFRIKTVNCQLEFYWPGSMDAGRFA